MFLLLAHKEVMDFNLYCFFTCNLAEFSHWLTLTDPHSRTEPKVLPDESQEGQCRHLFLCQH